MIDIKVRDLRDDLAYGATIEGVTREALADEGVRAQLNAVLKDRGMIVFEGVQPYSADMQVELSKVFGPLKDHPTKSTSRVASDLPPGLIDMHYKPRDGGRNVRGLVEVDGQVLARFSPWHFDHCYNDQLNYAGVLRAPINAPVRGRTGFVDGIELYRKMPARLIEKMDGLNVIYTLDTRMSQMRFGRNFKDFGDTPEVAGNVNEARIFPRAIHPAVWTRATGEKVLHVGPWMAVGIENQEDPEGEAFFEEFCQALIKEAYADCYWHDWKPNDMVIWDNWRMLHAVEGSDPKYERQTQRTTIEGDYGLGRFEGGKKIGEVYRAEVPDLVLQ
jgi:taurine dioxygenase